MFLLHNLNFIIIFHFHILYSYIWKNLLLNHLQQFLDFAFIRRDDAFHRRVILQLMALMIIVVEWTSRFLILLLLGVITHFIKGLYWNWWWWLLNEPADFKFQNMMHSPIRINCNWSRCNLFTKSLFSEVINKSHYLLEAYNSNQWLITVTVEWTSRFQMLLLQGMMMHSS